jgi:hypothetical protein
MTQYPSISITTFHDVEILVRYFECNRGSYDNVVESWIRDNIGEDKEILSYYSQQMGNTINNYWNIASKRSKVFNRRYREKLDKRIKRFEDLLIKLKAFKQEFEAMTISMTIESQWVYKVVSLPQPFASLLVMGLLDEFRVDNIGLCNEGVSVYVYATEMTQEAKEKLWYDNHIYGKFYNALEMGNLPNELPINAYIGQFRIKDYRPYNKIGVDKAFVFDKPIDCDYNDMPKFIATYSRHQAPIKKIRFRNRAIEVPLSEENWEKLGNMKDEFFLYWEDEYSQFCSLWGSNKDEQGLYDIVFYNGANRKRYYQLENQAVVCNVRKDKQTNLTFYVLEFCFEYIEEKTDVENNSFDILQKKDWILDWSCVRFKDGYIVVSAPLDDKVKFKTKAFPLKGSIEAFNYLKDYLNDRLSPVHCTVEKMNLNIYDQIRLNEAIEKFATASRQTGIAITGSIPTKRISPVQMSFKQALSKARQMTPEEFKKYKSKYIDYLVVEQSKEYKIVPCAERLAHTTGDTTEFAFLFSIPCGNDKVMIVHENVNPDRSTLLFLVRREEFQKSIRAIYDFLQSPEINKRSSLRSRDLEIDSAKILRYKSINHDDYSSWKQTIYYYKHNYWG